jgi:hypothetical protein
VKLSLCLIKHNTLETEGVVEEELHTFFTSARDGSGQLHAQSTLPTRKQQRYLLGRRLQGRAIYPPGKKKTPTAEEDGCVSRSSLVTAEKIKGWVPQQGQSSHCREDKRCSLAAVRTTILMNCTHTFDAAIRAVQLKATKTSGCY